MSLKILEIRYLQSFLVRDDLSHSFVPTSLPSLRPATRPSLCPSSVPSLALLTPALMCVLNLIVSATFRIHGLNVIYSVLVVKLGEFQDDMN